MGGLTKVVEVEGVVSGEGAVETGLEVARPARLVLVGAALVGLAHPGHAGVDALRKRGTRTVSQFDLEKSRSRLGKLFFSSSWLVFAK